MGGEKLPVFDGDILCSHWCDVAETSGLAGGTRCVSTIRLRLVFKITTRS
jgi:hypothetical protein